MPTLPGGSKATLCNEDASELTVLVHGDDVPARHAARIA
eukprot:CAMPEP_0177279960 /NCGR_PEP_ID=MMETSP0367-20130122/70107_1 /TAXON_ID=447022 ORGANISM="Scrippsiella hangoei-like, Strain SHHI-4" /NCGR_SAMPLE_ID=MMETSP0367 /ASSEMBLY_ACC=CAM_ASM_000362 /LENGTH=38 /DNA_ID= /DNA_START= /DNA_END= /DNA_ORIENTATION=